MTTRILLAIIVAALLTACGLTPTSTQRPPTPTQDATANARATSDAEFNAQVIATATALRLTAVASLSATAPAPTQPPVDTATPVPPTPTPAFTPEPTQTTPLATSAPTSIPPSAVPPSPLPPTLTPAPGQPVIVSFTVDRAKAQPGESVTLAWSATGGQTASLDQGICCTNNGGDEMLSVPPSGSQVVKLEATVERDRVNFWLQAGNASGAVTAQQHVDLPCPDTYFFSPSPALPCPASAPVTSAAAEQVFEHGRMLWLQSGNASGAIYVLYGDGTPKAAGLPPDGFVQYQDTWKEGEPESDPSLTPPASLYQPVRGFGKVWRASERDNLGWAVAPEQAFDGVMQRPWITCRHRDMSTGALVNCSSADANHTYLRAADGRLILLTGFLNHTPQHWEWVTNP